MSIAGNQGIEGDKSGPLLRELIELAINLGASGAASIDAGRIVVEEGLALMCRDPGCPNYGLSASCPPFVSGPEGFRDELRSGFRDALVLKLDVPTEVLISDERLEVFQLLHQIVSQVEHAATEKGFAKSRGFAGGSCKELFCQTERDCQVLAHGGPCRHPEIARPSMSGFGVNVAKLMEEAGWTMNKITSNTDPVVTPTSPVVGLVLVG